MVKSNIFVLSIIALQVVASLSVKTLEPLGKRSLASTLVDTFLSAYRDLNEASVLPDASQIYRFNRTSDVVKQAVFYSNLCRASNCRASLDKWDCENCLSTLPDGMVVRAFQTYPLGVTGEVVTSEKYIIIFLLQCIILLSLKLF